MTISIGYCSVQEVARYARRGDLLLSKNAPLSQNEIEAMIDAVGGELNAILTEMNFTTPVSLVNSPITYRYLAYVNAYCVAAEVTDRIFGDAGDSRGVVSMARRCQQLKDNLTKGVVNLSDAEGGSIPDNLLADAGTLDLLDTGVKSEPFFKRDASY